MIFSRKTISCVSILIGLGVSIARAELPHNPLFTWKPPTVFIESGLPLDPEKDIKEYRLYCTPGIETQVIVIKASSSHQWQAPKGFFPSGEYECHITAVTIEEPEGLESKPSNTITFTVKSGRPGPVTALEVM